MAFWSVQNVSTSRHPPGFSPKLGVELRKEIYVQTFLTAGSSLLDLAPGGQRMRETLRDRKNSLYADFIAGQDLTIDGGRRSRSSKMEFR
ncbi:uncharacterized protein METZ01_LOCUS364551 [marine metagenome]|uniref:Uncharacterized protein n=1 Tax=marine metagenome TaxID=408172 RepID=A0A382SR64_9ZZZZ